MKMLWTTINVMDLDKSLAFYRDIFGVDPNRRFKPAPGIEIAFLGEGEVQLELIQSDNFPEGIYRGLSIGFNVDSVDEKKAELEEKGYETTPIESPNPHLKFFFIKDPDGVSVQFAEHL